MPGVYIIADNITSPVGLTSADNFEGLCNDQSGVQRYDNKQLSPVPFYASLLNWATVNGGTTGELSEYTKFEQLLILSVAQALQQTNIDTGSARTGLILSSTKGNISLLEEEEKVTDELRQKISLSASAQKVATHFGFTSQPLVVSHACISGLVAIITGMRLLQQGKFDTIVVCGADIITRFILSGFQSFQAISPEPCKPFDAKRKGINLGEGAATVILSTTKPAGAASVMVTGGSVSNDANHISGPSRTGRELYLAVSAAMKEAGVTAADIDMISAHGTATQYNDDMESKAIHMAGLQTVPVNSLKGYYGHTLGAAGLIETVIAIHSLQANKIIPTRGFQEPGTSENINVCSTLQPGLLKTCLKTASGFGGCNAAIVVEKING